MSQRIAIFRALYLGDLLLAVPALRAIRAGFPRAEITLIGLPWAAAFVRRFCRYVDRFVEFVGYAGIREVDIVPERTMRFLEEQRAYGYDLVVQMHGSGRTSNPFVLTLGGKVTVGYYERMPTAGMTIQLPYPDDAHEIFRNLGLAKLLGCANLDPRLEFPLFDVDYAEANALLERLIPLANRCSATWERWEASRGRDKSGPYSSPLVGIHPGAHSPSHRWPAEYFAAVADHFARRLGAQILLTGGPDEEEIVERVAERMAMQAVNIAGETSLGGLAALIRELDLFISNDTGPAHIATAVGTPSVTIFGPVDYRRWAALDGTHHLIVRKPVECSPCSYWECPIDHRCLRWLRPEIVIEAGEQLLARRTVLCDV